MQQTGRRRADREGTGRWDHVALRPQKRGCLLGTRKMGKVSSAKSSTKNNRDAVFVCSCLKILSIVCQTAPAETISMVISDRRDTCQRQQMPDNKTTCKPLSVIRTRSSYCSRIKSQTHKKVKRNAYSLRYGHTLCKRSPQYVRVMIIKHSSEPFMCLDLVSER